jgi:diacylglycerol kinase (ATP)
MTNRPFFKQRCKSFLYAFRGIGFAFRTQHNLWIHLVLAAVAVGLGFRLKISRTEWCFIAFAIGLVIAAELFNTAIEWLVDMVSPEWNEKAGKVKDVAAAAVLVSAVTALAIGCIIFLPKLVALCGLGF